MLEMRVVDVLNNLRGWAIWPQSYHLSESEAQTCIKALEDAVNKPKTGHWTYILNSEVNGLKIVECSECGRRTYESGNYCPNCGAKMVDPQERSEE